MCCWHSPENAAVLTLHINYVSLGFGTGPEMSRAEPHSPPGPTLLTARIYVAQAGGT